MFALISLCSTSSLHHQYNAPLHDHSARFYTKEDSGCYDPDDDAFLDSTQKGEICLISPGLSKDQFIVMRKAERVLMYVILIEYSNVAEKNSVKIGVDYQ
jgi:hypothetical protein